jgi:hypothetical protein
MRQGLSGQELVLSSVSGATSAGGLVAIELGHLPIWPNPLNGGSGERTLDRPSTKTAIWRSGKLAKASLANEVWQMVNDPRAPCARAGAMQSIAGMANWPSLALALLRARRFSEAVSEMDRESDA